ncbi:HpcH/HpaI aldolase family protein [Aspergillus tubingensis]|uniref:2,4-dihydroxyhept-2-ene-1,7-dioic acid aldolase n=1 Tax=Aspergillus niger TaxID=5061 RepID=A0A100ILU9_ASPNG|nr:phosphoenolpyruvate/pyruvate domain-containing protein [Aspergillus tubingensis]GAQ43602.1 2,4-dihydroxyhept-2-ene-1,7-dioic acid aldolase [Aspergillus niger]GFN21411.1 phosphoenolpyruvate/pyruvate domain-containing protein [Aspergillus tubingensis]
MTIATFNPQLRLLNALRANAKPIMTFLGLPSFRTAQIVAQTGLDGIIIDCEHGHISDDSMHSATAAIASLGVSPLVRLRMTHSDLIKRALDAGAHGIVVPQINTAEEAQTVVSYSKFPPQGLRGQGSAFPAFTHSIDLSTYIKTANETLITCIQIETKQGVDNVEEICAVPGVDMIFIGPNDLALSILGYVPARGDEPEFVQAIEKIVAGARKHGKWVGRLSNNGTLGREHLKVFDTVALSYDIRAMQNWYTTPTNSLFQLVSSYSTDDLKGTDGIPPGFTTQGNLYTCHHQSLYAAGDPTYAIFAS